MKVRSGSLAEEGIRVIRDLFNCKYMNLSKFYELFNEIVYAILYAFYLRNHYSHLFAKERLFFVCKTNFLNIRSL